MSPRHWRYPPGQPEVALRLVLALLLCGLLFTGASHWHGPDAWKGSALDGHLNELAKASPRDQGPHRFGNQAWRGAPGDGDTQDTPWSGSLHLPSIAVFEHATISHPPQSRGNRGTILKHSPQAPRAPPPVG